MPPPFLFFFSCVAFGHFPSFYIASWCGTAWYRRFVGEGYTGVWGIHCMTTMTCMGGKIGHAFSVSFLILVCCGPGQGWLGSVRLFCFQRGDSRCCGGGEGRGEGKDVALDCPYLRGRDSLIDDVMQLAHSLSVPDSTTRRKERRQICEMTATRFGIVVVVSSAIWGVASGC